MTAKCKQCDYKSTRKDSLKLHEASIHGGVKYSCKNCDYQATEPSCLMKAKSIIATVVTIRQHMLAI